MIAITRIVVPNIVGYLRLSKPKKGRTKEETIDSAYGIDAQRDALARYAAQTGAKIIAEYREVESGRKSARPELAKALAHAKRSKATLVVAKLDRLSRNVAFLATLLETDCDFIACDNPHANRLTLHILAAVAEDEARRISERTKAGLAAAKAKGVLLGASNPKGRKLDHAAQVRGAKRAAEVNAAKARAAYADLFPLITQLRSMGLSQAAIADKLNEQGHTTRTGRPFSQPHVRRVLGMV